jgi:hypothetical protein
MPGVYDETTLVSALASLHRKVAALSAQQQFVISNMQGQPVIAGGRIPGSDPSSYGFQFLNPATNTPLAFFGEDGSGDAGMYFYDESGGTQSLYDSSGLHFYDTSGNEVCRLDSTGLHVYNSSGVAQLNAGQLTNGDYALEVIDASGQSNEVRPLYVSGSGSLTTSSTSPTAVPGTSVTATIGATGMAFVTLVGIGEMNGPASGGGAAYFAVGVDGAAPGSSAWWSELQTNLSAAQLTAPVSVSLMITGLSAGSHSFECYVWSDNTDHSALLVSAYTVVEPR